MKHIKSVIAVAAMMAVAGESASAQTYYSWCGYDYYGYYYCY